MATITSAQSGNFSDTATWVGGVVPGAGDDAVAATTHVVTIDVDATVISVQQAGTGKFTLGNGRTLTGNVIANAGTFTSGGTVDVIATTTATINGNITGVSTTTSSIAAVVISGTGTLTINGNITCSAGSAGATSSMVYTNANSTININGNITTTTGSFKTAVHSGPASSATINFISSSNIISCEPISGSWVNTQGAHVFLTQGPVSTLNVTAGQIIAQGRSAHCILMAGSTSNLTVNATLLRPNPPFVEGSSPIIVTGVGTINVTASVIEGSATGGNPAINTQGASTLVVTCPAINAGAGPSAHAIFASSATSTVNVVGAVKAASTLSHAIRSDATTNGVIFQGDMEDSPQGAVAVYTRIFRMTATNNGVTKYANTVGYPSGTLVSRVSPNNVTGMAATNNVRSGTVYGFNNELTGTVVIPPAQSVAYGVPVDATTGTAELDLGRVAEIIGLQVAAGATEGTSL